MESGNIIDSSASAQLTTHLPLQPRGNSATESGAISATLVTDVTQNTASESPQRSPGEAAVVEISMTPEARIARAADAYRTEKFSLPNPEHAAPFLQRMAAHPTLDAQGKNQNVQRAKDDVFRMHGSSRAEVDAKARDTGKLKNLGNWGVDLLALSASLVNVIMRRAHPEEFRSVQPGETPHVSDYAIKTARTFITLQFTFQFICAIYSARQLWRTVARQGPERRFVPIGMADNAGKLEAEAHEYKTAAKALEGEMRRGTVGEQLTPLIQEVEAKRAPLDNTLTVNKNKYISQAPENLAKVTRQLIVTGGLTLAIFKGNAHNAAGFIGQVIGMVYSWAAHYFVAGPAQEKLLEHKGMDNQLDRMGPQIAKAAAERAGHASVAHGPEMSNIFDASYRPDPETEAQLLQLLKGPQQIRAQAAAPFFSDDQAQAQAEFAAHVGLPPAAIARRDTLLQKDVRANVPALAPGERGPLPGKPLTAAERTELNTLNQQLDQRIAALPPDTAADTARLRTNLEQVAADIEHLENGTWDQIQPARQAIALAAAEGDTDTLARMVANRVGNTFVEAGPNIVQKVASTYNGLVLNSAALISWSAIRQLKSAEGTPIDPKIAIAVTWVLYVGYVAGTVFGGANATQGKLINRAAWVNEFRHAPPDVRQKAWMLMKASFIGVMGLPLEIKRLGSIQLAIRTANRLLEEGKRKETQAPPAEQSV